MLGQELCATGPCAAQELLDRWMPVRRESLFEPLVVDLPNVRVERCDLAAASSWLPPSA